MIEINLILSLFFFTVFSFFEIIVFNEEILLTLCFLAFLFYCFSTLSESVSSSLEARAFNFESDLLLNFSNSKDSFVNCFSNNLKLQNIINKFSILIIGLSYYISVCNNLLESKSSWIFFQNSITKLNELSLTNQNFIFLFQKSCVVQLLYSLILKKSIIDLTFLTLAKSPKFKLANLKNLSN